MKENPAIIEEIDSILRNELGFNGKPKEEAKKDKKDKKEENPEQESLLDQ